MDFAQLIGKALHDRGNAVMVLARPEDGEYALVQTVNAPFAEMIGRAGEPLAGLRVASLRDLVASPEDWSAIVASLRDGAPLRLDLKLRVQGRDVWFGFGLTFNSDPATGARHGIVIGRDITQARRRAFQELESQRLLASVFMRIAVPVVVVRMDGIIVMANQACQRLLGYAADELIGRSLAGHITPDFMQGMPSRTMPDSDSHEIRLDAVNRDGTHIPVLMVSSALREAPDLRLRAVTLVLEGETRVPAEREPPASRPDVAASGRHNVGQIQAISLAALRAAFADEWPRIASRAMMMAEQIIKRRLSAADVFSRGDDYGFYIWFDSTDSRRNEAVLAASTREIRLRFLTELGEEMSSHVGAVMVTSDAKSQQARDRTGSLQPSAELLARLRDERQRGALEAKTLLAELRDGPVADIAVVTDREHRIKPVVLVDFAPSVRGRMAHLASSLADDTGEHADIDLLRLDLAISELGERRAGRVSVLVPLAWQALVAPGRRRAFDDRLAGMEADLRQHLMLAVSGVPPLPSDRRWSSVAAPLRRQIGEVGLMLSLNLGDQPSVHEAIVSEWPLSLLVIDATEPAWAPPDGYFGIIAAARRREIPVLVRPAVAGDGRDWRELGATMFAGGLKPMAR